MQGTRARAVPPPVRAAVAADAPEAARLLRQLACVRSDGTQEGFAAAVAAALRDPGPMRLRVCGPEGGPLSGLALAYVLPTPGAGATVHLHDLVVDGSARGQGLGRALVADALALARAEGAAMLQARTDEGNAGAEALYASLGLARADVLWEAEVPRG